MGVWRGITSRWLAGLLVLAAPCLVAAQPPAVAAAELKAAYLLRFAGFVEWPAGLPPSLGVAVAGAPEVLASLLSQGAARPAGAPEVSAREVQAGDALDGVQLLFVAGPRSFVESWTLRLQGRPLLLVTDVAEGLPAGSAINFVRVGERLRFEVSLAVLERARLKVSSRLLGAAMKVVE